MILTEDIRHPNPANDGVTHVNVYSHGRTELGRLLSNFAHTPFTFDGALFASVEGFWYYTVSGDAVCRGLSGTDAKTTGRRLPALHNPPNAELLSAVYRAKLAAHPTIARALAASTLPFFHYYVYDGVGVPDGVRDAVRVPEHALWTAQLWEALRAEAQRAAARVVNCRREPYDVLVGRPSKWGNPYSHLDDTLARFRVSSRDEAIQRYEEWIKTQPELMAALPELRGKVLGCFCAPRPCHGEVLLRLANPAAETSLDELAEALMKGED